MVLNISLLNKIILFQVDLLNSFLPGDILSSIVWEMTSHGLTEDNRGSSEEEVDLVHRSKKRNKERNDEMEVQFEKGDPSGRAGESKEKRSYKDSAMGTRGVRVTEEDFLDDGEISDDDAIEEGIDESSFGMGMTREEKIEARRPWRNSLIVKMVGRIIGCHFLRRRIQVMWRTQVEPLLIDKGNNFFIVKLYKREEYVRALSEGPWMIEGNYLHAQRWRANFTAETAEITSLPV